MNVFDEIFDQFKNYLYETFAIKIRFQNAIGP